MIEQQDPHGALERVLVKQTRAILAAAFHRPVFRRGLRMLTKPKHGPNGYWFSYTAAPPGILGRDPQVRPGSRAVVVQDGHRFYADLYRHVAQSRSRLHRKVGLSRQDKLAYIHAVERLRIGESLITHFWAWSTTVTRIA